MSGSSFKQTVLDRGKRIFARSPPGSLLPHMGGRPLLVVLVGARGGPAERWREFGRDVELFGLEPDPTEHRRLTDARSPGERYVCIAAGSERGHARLNLTREPGCSSFYAPNHELISQFSSELSHMFEVVGAIDVETAPLDEIVAEHGVTADVLSVDVQGAELSVLRGASRLLDSVKLVELEVELNPQYVGQPLFSDVDPFLRRRGYELLGLRRTLWRRKSRSGANSSVAGGQLIHADALYLNRAALDRATTSAELVLFMLALSAYHQHDFVEYLLDEHPLAGQLSGSDRLALRAQLVPPVRPLWRLARRALALFHLPHHMTLRALLVALRGTPADDWHDPDFF
ncbi:MAG: FkbM family methyltransferase [Myxococcales bacterium]|nr:FkbM family methyltransferase [Myxococcales bacterium]